MGFIILDVAQDDSKLISFFRIDSFFEIGA